MAQWQYFIGLSLPDPYAQDLADIKAYYHPKNHLSSPPHITLAIPFFWHDEQELIVLLRRFAQKEQPFHITLSKIGSFRHCTFGTVYIAPERTEDIKKLVISLKRTIRDLPVPDPFVPHLTLAQRVPFTTMTTIKRELRARKLKISSPITQLTLFRRELTAVWDQFRNFSLGQNT